MAKFKAPEVTRILMVRADNYPGTQLPTFDVFDAEEYNDPTLRNVRPIGSVWAVGNRVIEGYRFGLAGEDALSQALRADETSPLATPAKAAYALLTAYNA